MRFFSLLILTTVNFYLFPQTDSASNKNIDIEQALGTWTIDLKPTPDAESYFKEFVIEKIDGNSFSGKFYDTEFENGQFNLDWDKLYFAFTTNDANNTYFHSGYKEGYNIFGISFSPERSFTAPWAGQKSD